MRWQRDPGIDQHLHIMLSDLYLRFQYPPHYAFCSQSYYYAFSSSTHSAFFYQSSLSLSFSYYITLFKLFMYPIFLLPILQPHPTFSMLSRIRTQEWYGYFSENRRDLSNRISLLDDRIGTIFTCRGAPTPPPEVVLTFFFEYAISNKISHEPTRLNLSKIIE